MIDKTQTADILRAAATKIREVGWTQGAALRDGHLCALGGIGIVTECEVTVAEIESASRIPTFLSAESALKGWLQANGFPGFSVVFWNDMPGRTMDDVVTGMEKAAAWIEEQA